MQALTSGAGNGAKELRISRELTDFPREVFEHAETLEILDLSGNRLASLPEDFDRLRNLRIAFFSQNEFEVLPEVLSRCPRLEMVGFKSCRIRSLGESSLPAQLRWLILTDNRLERLPDSIGTHPRLQKLMLAGNRLRELPESLSTCRNLELLRISANHLERFPGWLADLPRLSWIAWSGNPFSRRAATPSLEIPAIPFSALELGEVLGQGASGVISRAAWRGPDGTRDVAVKVFKGKVTSDGDPDDERDACLAAGRHPHLVELQGRLVDHPEGRQGLVMALVPSRYRNLAGPPSYATCTRDVFPAETGLDAPGVLRIARAVASLGAHLHASGVNHGDLYAHNILVDDRNHALLGDFGAASLLEGFELRLRERLQRVEVRAYGCLLDDLLGVLGPDAGAAPLDRVRWYRDACLSEEIEGRPLFGEIAREL